MSVAAILSSLFDPSAQSTQSKKPPLQQEFQQLGKDLQSGNVPAAQQDYSAIQQGLQNGTAQLHAHHHHRVHGGGEGGQFSQLFDQLGQALQSGNLTSAQQAYTTLQQDFQQFSQTGSQQSPAPARTRLSRGWRLLAAGLRELLEVLLQRGVSLLGGREVARLQCLTQLIEQLDELAAFAAAVNAVMMVRVQLRRSILQTLLNGRVVLLRRRNVAGLQILAELLELLLERRLFGLQALHGRIENAAEYSCYGHGCLLLSGPGHREARLAICRRALVPHRVHPRCSCDAKAGHSTRFCKRYRRRDLAES